MGSRGDGRALIEGIVFLLRSDERRISSAPCHQFLMRSLFHDSPSVQDQDEIRIANGAQAMGNDDSRTR